MLNGAIGTGVDTRATLDTILEMPRHGLLILHRKNIDRARGHTITDAGTLLMINRNLNRAFFEDFLHWGHSARLSSHISEKNAPFYDFRNPPRRTTGESIHTTDALMQS